MKIFLFLVAVVVLLWLLRGSFGRRGGPGPAAPPRSGPRPIVACAQCGVHLPRDEALPGRGGIFCGEAHRVAFEEANANDR